MQPSSYLGVPPDVIELHCSKDEFDEPRRSEVWALMFSAALGLFVAVGLLVVCYHNPWVTCSLLTVTVCAWVATIAWLKGKWRWTNAD